MPAGLAPMVKRVNDSGEPYIMCGRCGKDGDMPQRPLMSPD